MANFSRNKQSQFISVSKHKLLVYLLTQERWKLNFIFIDVYKFLSDGNWNWVQHRKLRTSFVGQTILTLTFRRLMSTIFDVPHR